MRILLKRPFRYVLIAVGVILLAPAAIILLMRWVNPPLTAYMVRTHLQTQHSGDGPTIFYRWVDLDSIAACMPLAAIAAEDQTFPVHHGFAWKAITDALADNANGGNVRGASTISQQTAKNLFLWPAKSYVRKAIEAYLTAWLEVLWSKRRIIEVYLNVAQFDDRVFGVGAAADRLFGVQPSQLSNGQCASLAAVLPDPGRYSAASPGPYVQRQKVRILRQMRQLGDGYISQMIRP